MGKGFFIHKPHFAKHHFQIVKRGYVIADFQPEITSGIWLLGKNDFESEAFALIVRWASAATREKPDFSQYEVNYN